MKLKTENLKLTRRRCAAARRARDARKITDECVPAPRPGVRPSSGAEFWRVKNAWLCANVRVLPQSKLAALRFCRLSCRSLCIWVNLVVSGFAQKMGSAKDQSKNRWAKLSEVEQKWAKVSKTGLNWTKMTPRIFLSSFHESDKFKSGRPSPENSNAGAYPQIKRGAARIGLSPFARIGYIELNVVACFALKNDHLSQR